MSDISIIGGYRITNQFPCFLRPIYRAGKRNMIQIEDSCGDLLNYEEISGDLNDEGPHIVFLAVQIDKTDDKVDYGFAFDESDIIIEPLDIFCKKLNARRKELPPVIDDIFNEYLRKRRLQLQYRLELCQDKAVLYPLNPAIAQSVANLTEREKAVIFMRYGQNQMTQREVADTIGVSRSYVSKLEKSALEKTPMTFQEYVVKLKQSALEKALGKNSATFREDLKSS